MTALATAHGSGRLGDVLALTDGYAAAFLGAAAIAGRLGDRCRRVPAEHQAGGSRRGRLGRVREPASRSPVGVSSRGGASARRDEARFVGKGDESCTVATADLAQDVADVRLGGQRADDEPARDLVVAQPLGNQPRISRLRAVSSARGVGVLVGSGRAANSAIRRLVDARREEGVARCDDLDGVQQVSRAARP
jgi:hypothetical protein